MTHSNARNRYLRPLKALAPWLLGLLLVLVLAGRMFQTYGRLGGPRWHTNSPLPAAASLFSGTAPSVAQRAIADSLTVLVTRNNSGSDTGFIANVAVTNRAGLSASQIVIECDGVGESGVAIGHARATLPGVVPAHDRRTFDNVTIPFQQRNVASARCTAAELVAGH